MTAAKTPPERVTLWRDADGNPFPATEYIRADIVGKRERARENARLEAMLTKSSEDNDAWVEMLEERDRLAARQDDRAELMVALGKANLENVRLEAENAELRQALVLTAAKKEGA